MTHAITVLALFATVAAFVWAVKRRIHVDARGVFIRSRKRIRLYRSAPADNLRFVTYADHFEESHEEFAVNPLAQIRPDRPARPDQVDYIGSRKQIRTAWRQLKSAE